jgi:hypothetical protein
MLLTAAVTYGALLNNPYAGQAVVLDRYGSKSKVPGSNYFRSNPRFQTLDHVNEAGINGVAS